MAIDIQLYDTATLLGVMRDMAPPSNYWLDLLYPTVVNSDDEFIDFEKVTSMRKLAPFVSPNAQGRPIYSRGSTVTRIKPSYVKPKDAVTAARMLRRRPGDLAAPMSSLSPQQRFNAVVTDILAEHRTAIERRWEWLAAQAAIYGEVTIADQDMPARTISFGRNPNHTVDLTVGTMWSDPSADIIGDIEDWRYMVQSAKFGGPTNRLTVGVNAWKAMRKNTKLLDQLDTQVRATDGNFRTGVMEGLDVEYVGRISATLDVYVYRDYYEDAAGNAVPFMSPNDVLLSGPNFMGVRAFGAILDIDAGFQPLEIHSKMWDNQDPSVRYLMSQSAPLMIPVNPDNTVRATVVDDTV